MATADTLGIAKVCRDVGLHGLQCEEQAAGDGDPAERIPHCMNWQAIGRSGRRLARPGIRGKLVLTLLISSVPGLLLLGFYAAGVLEDMERSWVVEQLADQGWASAQDVEDMTALAASDALLMARSPTIRAFTAVRLTAEQEGDTATLEDLARRALVEAIDLQGIYTSAALVGLDGHEWVRVDCSLSDGRTRPAPDSELRDLSGRDYVKAAIGLPPGVPRVVGPLQERSPFSPSTEHLVLLYVVPIGRPEEKASGLVITSVDADRLTRAVRAQGEWLVDATGRFVSGPGPQWPGNSSGKGDRASLQTVLSPGALAALAVTGTAHDQGMLLIGLPVRVARPGPTWSLIVVADERDVEATIRARLAPPRYWLTVVAGAGFLGPVLAAYVLSSFFIRAVPRLRKAAQAVATGDFSHRVSVNSKDEMEDLARDFNAMAARLEELGHVERALALEKLKDDLIHMIVHDLRTPLTSVLSGLQTVQHANFDPDTTRELVPNAISASHTLLMMINDLLDINRMENGVLTLGVEEVDVGAVCHEAADMVALLAGEKGLRLVCEVSDGIAPIRGDREMVLRIATNLLGNAVKFTPAGGEVAITVHAERNTPGVHITVRDSGEGIPAEYRDRIFEKFGQVETRKARRVVSTGLGLTFCKMATEAHGGKIRVDSEMGVGSVFHVMLPRDLACPVPQATEGCLPEENRSQL